MVPAIFIPLGVFPLTPNGKVDRGALPSPAGLAALERENYAAPVDNDETALCGLFQEVLGCGPVGRNDNFFDLGGHSLAAIRLVSLLSDGRGHEVPVRSVFQNPTVAELVAELRSGGPRDGACAQPSPAGPEPSVAGDPRRRRNVRIHRHPLLEQIRGGALPSVDAAAVSTCPNELRHTLETSPPLQALSRQVNLVSISDTASGRIASLWLPIYTRDVYREGAALLTRLLEALDLAEEIGAAAVSLTGLLGSATAQGADLVAARDRAGRSIAVTTGHATVVASILLAIDGIVAAAHRSSEGERVAILGMGSIGTAVAETLLASRFVPKEMLLCDVYARRDVLARTAADLGARFQRCAVRAMHGPAGALPDDVYDATLVVGATNATEVLDPARLQPGTLIVDDSAPHCFDTGSMLERIQRENDLLVTTGGLLSSPRPVFRDLFLPEAIEGAAAEHDLALPIQQPDVIPACALSALLTATRSSIVPTVGACSAGECLRHADELRALDMRAASIQLAGRLIDDENIASFARRFGHR
jgi:hypothetical protein